MKFALPTAGILAFFLSTNIAQARLLDLSFQRITTNNTENIADQLSAKVYDKAQALTDFSSTSTENLTAINAMTSDKVLFTFSNSAEVTSSIGEIYFDDGTIFKQTTILNSLSGDTDFSDGGKNGINPGDLPGGNTISPIFQKTADFGADTQGNLNNGVNTINDILGIVIQLFSDVDFDGLQDSLVNGDLRLGLRVKSIGSADGSDSFINNPFGAGGPATIATPIPAAMWLFGPALLGLAGTIRRKSTKTV